MKEKLFKKRIKRRLFSVALAVAMIITLIPSNITSVQAANLDGPHGKCSGCSEVTEKDEFGEHAELCPGGQQVLFVECDSEHPCGAPGCPNSTPAHGHIYSTTWSSDSTQHWYACTSTTGTCDAPKSSLGDHTGGTATCQAKAVCSVCSAEYGEKVAHDYGYSATNNVLTASCKTSGCTESHTLTLTASSANYSGSAYTGASLSNTTAWTTAGLTEPTIKYEGRVTTTYTENETAPTDIGTYTAKITAGEVTATADFAIHGPSTTYGYDETNHWFICAITGCTEESHKFESAAHIYDEGTHRCTCEKMDPDFHQHTYGAWSKDDTNHWHECTDPNCPETDKGKKDNAAHTWGSWNSSTGTRSCTVNCGATETCTHNGATTGTCSICKKYLGGGGGGYTPAPAPIPTPVTPAPIPTPVTPTPNNNGGGTIGGAENSGTNISVNTNNGNATISSIPENTVNDIANNTTETAIVIDVSKVENNGNDITKVTIPKETVEKIADALISSDNNKESLIINTNTAAIKIDATALASIADQAKAGNIQIVVENKAEVKLNNSQKAAVDSLNQSTGKNVVQTFEAYFVSGGTRISSFGGGEISIGKLDFDIPAGKNAKNYHVYYISESGQSERYPTWVENGSIFFRTTHLSDYAIVYDETMTNGIGKEVYRLFNSENGDHLFTASQAERNAAERGGWKYEGVAFIAIEEGKKVYRLFNPASGEHFFTTSEAERDALVALGWNLEGNAFLSYGETQVYRLLNPGGMHMFTISEKERDALVKLGWIYEGVGFKAN